jgi:hypothetical protein
MTDAKGKVREFWFDVEQVESDSYDTSLYFEKPDFETQYHVIEKSHYDRCVAERDEAKAEHDIALKEILWFQDKLKDRGGSLEFIDAYDKLLAERDEARLEIERLLTERPELLRSEKIEQQSALLDLAVAALEFYARCEQPNDFLNKFNDANTWTQCEVSYCGPSKAKDALNKITAARKT